MTPLRSAFVVILFTLFVPRAGLGQDTRPPPPKPPAVDAHGDPLPEGALARLGTLRFRTPSTITAAALAPGGKVFAAANGETLHLFDALSGAELRRIDSPAPVYTLCFSPGGQALAGTLGNNQIQLWEVATGKVLRSVAPAAADDRRPVHVALSGDGKALAVGREHLGQKAGCDVQIHVPGAEQVRTIELKQNGRAQVALSSDGLRLLTWGQSANGPVRDPLAPRTLQLWEVVTGKELRRFVLDQSLVAGAALSPDGKRVAAVGTGATVYVFDSDGDKEPLRLAGRHSPVARAVQFSPDGKRLAVSSPEGVTQVWDLEVGRQLATHEEATATRLGGFAFTADGKAVAWRAKGEAFSLWEVLSGKPVSPAAAHQSGVTALSFASGGKELHAASVDGHILVWDIAEAKLLRSERLPDDARHGHSIGELQEYWTWLFPDGRHALGANPGGPVRLWDRQTGKIVLDFDGPSTAWTGGPGVAAPADGRLLALSDASRTVQIWDARDGRLLHRIPFKSDKQGSSTISRLAFSPRGDRLAVAQNFMDPTGNFPHVELMIVGTAEGKELRRVHLPNASLSALTFSADGRAVAFGVPARSGNFGVELRSAVSGEVIQRLELSRAYAQSLAFSPDGRTLAVGMSGYVERRPDGEVAIGGPCVTVWELATNQIRFRFTGHSGSVNCLAYAPDGRTLTTGAADTTVLLWDLTGKTLIAGDKSPPGDREVALWWEDLALSDGERGFRAVARLFAAPEQALALLGKNLRPSPVAKVGPEEVAKLIAQLSDSKFDTRDRAQKRLEELGENAAAPLRKALAAPTSEEQRRRIDNILQRLDRHVLTPEEVRQVRAIEALERLATPAARELLERLAEGAAGARLTREARAALARLRSGMR